MSKYLCLGMLRIVRLCSYTGCAEDSAMFWTQFLFFKLQPVRLEI